MKRLSVKAQADCMACLDCERACSEAFYKEFDQTLTCVRIGTKDNANKTFVCVQCGKCAKNCEAEAISKNAKGVFMIDKKKCTNCGKCIEVCPFKVIVKSPAKEHPSKCVACGICVKVCPMDVLEIVEKD